MLNDLITPSTNPIHRAQNALEISVKSWFAIALVGQWAFALYVFSIYAVTYFADIDLVGLSPASGVEKTQGIDRFVFFFHILPTVYLSLFGLLQLVPTIRTKYRSFHRINGRIFLLLGISGALTGLYLQWMRDLTFSAGISINGILILLAGGWCWHSAIKKRFDSHRRFAVHTFILVNGVWSFRLYLMAWYMVNQGPNGNTANVDGPMDITISFACYLIPMLIAECYFWLKNKANTAALLSGTAIVATGALITAIGVVAAVTMMWTPRLEKLWGLL